MTGRIYPALALGLLAASTAAAQAPTPARVDPDQFPLALHRSMEIDDLDREVQRIHDAVLTRRAQLATSRRLAQKGLVSRDDIEREASELRYQEAREAESRAFRAIKAYERDHLGMAEPADERKAFSLLLDWVRKQGAIAQVEVDYRAYDLKQTKALFQRNAVSRDQLENAELAHNTALAGAALSKAREAQVMVELAVRLGVKPYDPVEVHRLKSEYFKARVRHAELNADSARRRLSLARDRARSGLVPPTEVELFEKAAAEATDALTAEKKTLATHEAEPPRPARPGTRSDAAA